MARAPFPSAVASAEGTPPSAITLSVGVAPSAGRSEFIARSRPNLRFALCTRLASYELRVTSRKTLTVLRCPMRWDRAIACNRI